jgi:hypothetical protein
MSKTPRSKCFASRVARVAAVAWFVVFLSSPGLAAEISSTANCDDSDLVKPGVQIIEGEILNCDVNFTFSDANFIFERVTFDGTSITPGPANNVSGMASFIPSTPLGDICTVVATQMTIQASLNVGQPAIVGNAACSDAPGETCDAGSGAGCVLPCIVCKEDQPGTDDVAAPDGSPPSGLSCPGTGENGRVYLRFQGIPDCTIDPCPTALNFEVLSRAEGWAFVEDGSRPPERAAGAGPTPIECVPGEDGGGEGFKCYRVKEPGRRTFRRQDVTLLDQFDDSSSSATVLAPYELCAPASKDEEPVTDEDSHLLCYKIRSWAPRVARFVTDTDQFGDENLRVGPAVELCLPAIKNDEGTADENHFQCYQARPSRGIPLPFPIRVELEDQFETKDTDLLRTSLHCNPVDKNGGGIPYPSRHLKCYNIQDASEQDPFPGERVTTSDQFGPLTLQVGTPTRFCEPACKNHDPACEAVCGNGILEPGEECEVLADCPAGFEFCSNCTCAF